MRDFFDTSVLVACFYGDHEHHEHSIALFAAQTRESGCTAAHCLVETYAVVTGMPGKNRAAPEEALLFLDDVRDRLTLIALDEDEYVRTIRDAVEHGVSGGGIYDAATAAAALKADAETIYTWNIRNFSRLGEAVAARVKEP